MVKEKRVVLKIKLKFVEDKTNEMIRDKWNNYHHEK